MSLEDFSLELRLLIFGCLRGIEEAVDEEWASLVANSAIDWQDVYDLVATHGVRPLLLKAFTTSRQPIPVPQAFLQQLEMEVRQLTLRTLLNQHELTHLLQRLQGADITAIPYKGAILSQLLYGNASLRESSDIDLFIYRQDIQKIRMLFKSLDIKEVYPMHAKMKKWMLKISSEFSYVYTKNKYSFLIEPHYRSNHSVECLNLYLEDIDDHIRILELNDVAVPVFDLEASLLLMITNHGVTDRWEKLRHLIDFHQFIQKYADSVDWDWVHLQLKRLDIINVFLSGLQLSNTLFQTPIPARYRCLCERSRIRRLVNNRLNFLRVFHGADWQSEIRSLQYRVISRSSYLNKFLLLYRTIWLPTNMDLQETGLSPRWYFLLPLFRPFRMLKTHVFSR